MRYIFFCALAFFPVLLFASTDPQKAAAEWVEVIDAGKYGEAWDQGALTLRLRVNRQIWEALMGSMRKPLGTVKERKLVQAIPAQDPENMPKGDYMIVLFETVFRDGKTRHEMVTLVLESDGKWRPLTYHAG